MRHFFILYILGFCNFVFSQDPHFSQYFSSPLTLNPATTGNFNAPARLATNYRNQWSGIGNPYITGTISFDSHILNKNKNRINHFGFGVLGLYDRTLNGFLNNTHLGLSLGYHIWTNEDLTEKISIGFQAVLNSKSFDFSHISFADQFSSNGFDLTLPSNQTFQNTNYSYIDINTGLMYSREFEKSFFYLGVAGYHLNLSKESALNNNYNSINIRSVIHSGLTLHLGNDLFMFSGQYMHQGAVDNSIFGFTYGKNIDFEDNDIYIYLGTSYRIKDALIPYIGYTYNNFQLGLTYDINNSSLSYQGKKNQSFEISIIYLFRDRSEYKKIIPWY